MKNCVISAIHPSASLLLLPPLVNTTIMYLNFSICCRVFRSLAAYTAFGLCRDKLPRSRKLIECMLKTLLRPVDPVVDPVETLLRRC